MTYSLRDTARSQMKSRLMKIDASSGSAGTAVSEDYGNKAAGPSSSAKFKRGGAVRDHDSDDKSMRRPDRPHRASGGAVRANKGKTNVNIIIAPQGGGEKEPMAVPMPMPQAGPPMAPPGPPMGPPPGGGQVPPELAAALAGGGGGPPPGMPMRKRGGAVKMDDGAGSGPGRLEKIEKYGKNAKAK